MTPEQPRPLTPAELTLPLAAERLIPHRRPLQLIDRLLSWEAGSGVVEAVPAAGNPLLDSSGRLDPVALVELLAQAYAAIHGYGDVRLGRPVKEGFLVAVRRIRISGTAQLGDRLQVEVRTVGAMAGFAVAEGEVRCGDTILAAGSLKLWIPETNEP